jgi:hypothetical protein
MWTVRNSITRLFNWRVAAVPFMVAAALIGTTLPSSASTGADGFPIISASSDGQVHHCEVIGSADGYQAVVCADIVTLYFDSTAYESGGVIEAYCQTDSGTVVRCANIYAEGVFANAAGGQGLAGSYACGHTYGACPSGRALIGSDKNYDYSDGAPSCSDNADSTHDVWTVVYAYNNTQIELPVSNHTFELGSNFSSGHDYVCP